MDAYDDNRETERMIADILATEDRLAEVSAQKIEHDWISEGF